jgi:hypothetical protein
VRDRSPTVDPAVVAPQGSPALRAPRPQFARVGHQPSVFPTVDSIVTASAPPEIRRSSARWRRLLSLVRRLACGIVDCSRLARCSAPAARTCAPTFFLRAGQRCLWRSANEPRCVRFLSAARGELSCQRSHGTWANFAKLPRAVKHGFVDAPSCGRANSSSARRRGH